MEQLVHEIFGQFAHQPFIVYASVCGFMVLSAFGLPIPEEVVLISSGLIAFVALKNPPTDPNIAVVNVYVLAAVAFVAVMGSDYLIYCLGRWGGPKLFRSRWFSRLVSEASVSRIQRWMRKYGAWTVIVFRFTPGVRFPGHLMCGAMGLPTWKFLSIDWIAAGISVPTQVLLVAFYGEYILQYFTQFKVVFFSALALVVTVILVNKYLARRRDQEVAPIAAVLTPAPIAETLTPNEQRQHQPYR